MRSDFIGRVAVVLLCAACSTEAPKIPAATNREAAVVV